MFENTNNSGSLWQFRKKNISLHFRFCPIFNDWRIIKYFSIKESSNITMTEKEFESFYKSHYRGLLAYAYQMVPDIETCRDLLSDAFESVWDRSQTMRQGELRSLLFSIIKNKCVDHLRHLEVEERYMEQMQFAQEESEEMFDSTSSQYRLQLQVFKETIKTLTPHTREIFTSCYLHNQTYQQVADQHGISTSAVKKHVMQALASFREAIAKKTK